MSLKSPACMTLAQDLQPRPVTSIHPGCSCCTNFKDLQHCTLRGCLALQAGKPSSLLSTSQGRFQAQFQGHKPRVFTCVLGYLKAIRKLATPGGLFSGAYMLGGMQGGLFFWRCPLKCGACSWIAVIANTSIPEGFFQFL